MKEILDILKTRYETAINSQYDSLFYRNVHEYVDWIFKNPKLNSILENNSNEYRTKHSDIWEHKSYTEKELKEKSMQTYKLERFSLYANYFVDLEMRIYWPIEIYKTSNEPDYLQDPFAVMLLNNGYDKLPIKEWRKLSTENNRPNLWDKDSLKSYDNWYKGQRKNYEIKLRQFHADFLTEIERTKESNVLEINDGLTAFEFKPRTGDFRYYQTEGTIALGTNEFKMFSLLYRSIGIFVDHLTLSRVMNTNITTVSKSHKDSLSQVIRNLKEKFGILPKTKTSNPDFFKNNPKAGYRLIFKDINTKTE